MTPRSKALLAPLLLAPALLALALVPTGHACSLAGPVPGPGQFQVRPVEGGPPVRVDVEGRMLGAMCDLSNPYAVGGGWFVWFEHDQAGGPWSLHARDLATGETLAHENVTPRHVEALGTDGARAYWYERGWTRADATDDHAFMTLDLATGDRARLDLPPAGYVDVAIDRSLLVMTTRAPSNASAPMEVGAYDAREARWVLPPTSTFDLELGPQASLHDVDARSGRVLLDADRVLDLATRATTRLDRGAFMPVGLDGGYAYSFGAANLSQPQGLWRQSLASGGHEAVDPNLFQRPLGVQDGRVVLGAYGAPPPREAAPAEPRWGSRDQGFGPRGPGVPDVWAPRDLVQGETTFVMVLEFDSPNARVEVTDAEGRVVFRDELRLARHGEGYSGETAWRVPRTLPPGRYDVTAVSTSGEARAQDEVVLHEAPRLFATPPEPRLGRLRLEAAGFDAAPLTATFVQGELRWEARWSVGRGEPRAHDNLAEVVLAPGAQDPRRLLQAGGGSESVTLSPLLVVPEGQPLLAWFNGTYGGEPRTLGFRWTSPGHGAPGPYVRAPETVVHAEGLEVVLHGFQGNVRLGWQGNVTEHETVAGFAQAVLPVSLHGGGTLTVEGTLLDGTDASFTREVLVLSPPVPASQEEDRARPLPAPPALALLVLATLAALARRRA